MTDEEIERALASCGTVECNECSYKYKCIRLSKDTLDYINRLKEKIHEIRQENIRDRKRVRKDMAKEILQAIAECRTVQSDVRGKRYTRYELDQKDFENIADRFGVEVDDD